MGSIVSSPTSFEEVTKQECYKLLSEFSDKAHINSEACFKSAEKHSTLAGNLEKLGVFLGSLGFGGTIGTLAFHRNFPLKMKAALVGTSSVLLGTYINLILHTADRGIKSKHSPFTLSARYTESGAAWRELQEMCLFHSKVTVHDPYVSLKELENVTMEMIRRKRDISRRIKPENWAVSEVIEQNFHQLPDFIDDNQEVEEKEEL